MKNKYLCFYRGKQVTVEADTTYQAQKLAALRTQARKSFEVVVKLVELNGQPYIHSTASI